MQHLLAVAFAFAFSHGAQDQCYGCRYDAFFKGAALTDEKGEPLRFATQADARRYEQEYHLPAKAPEGD